jgi:hypothetical protein
MGSAVAYRHQHASDRVFTSHGQSLGPNLDRGQGCPTQQMGFDATEWPHFARLGFAGCVPAACGWFFFVPIPIIIDMSFG